MIAINIISCPKLIMSDKCIHYLSIEWSKAVVSCDIPFGASCLQSSGSVEA